MHTKRTITAAAILGLAGALYSQAAAAQQEAQPPATMEAPAATFDEGTLHSFVTAFLQVDEINRAYTPQMQTADTTEEQQQIQQQATQEMVMAVENTEGISVEEYNVIMETVQTDPALAQQINEMISEAVGE